MIDKIYHLTIENIEKAERSALLYIWHYYFKVMPPKAISKAMLKSVLLFEAQSKLYGGLNKKTQNLLQKGIADPSDKKALPKTSSAQLKSGARLMREWNGITYHVDVTEAGFMWKGTYYKSLSSIAKSITGAHWSGPRFFGLNKKLREERI